MGEGRWKGGRGGEQVRADWRWVPAERPHLDFLDAIAVHDVEDLVSDALPVATPAKSHQHHPHPLPRFLSCSLIRVQDAPDEPLLQGNTSRLSESDRRCSSRRGRASHVLRR